MANYFIKSVEKSPRWGEKDSLGRNRFIAIVRFTKTRNKYTSASAGYKDYPLSYDLYGIYGNEEQYIDSNGNFDSEAAFKQFEKEAHGEEIQEGLNLYDIKLPFEVKVKDSDKYNPFSVQRQAFYGSESEAKEYVLEALKRDLAIGRLTKVRPNMTRKELINQIFTKKTFLCVGLDTDIKKIPEHLLKEEDPIFAFNKAIIDATAPYCVAYKPNLAFYESMGVKGWISFEKTITYLNENYPQHFIIADAKRGDIGNTSAMYARTFFEEINLDALTVAPYMGEDSVTPFLQYEGKWVILLALTSNKGSNDFQLTTDAEGERLFEKVLRKSQEWGDDQNMMYVVGATQGKMFEDIRKVAPDHFLLVPGIGAQGGSLEEVCKYGMTKDCGLIVNSSRAIIYADKTEKFAEVAAQEAKKVAEQMAKLLES